MDNLFNSNIELVYRVAKLYKGPKDDIVQAGLMGLFEASKTYDKNKGKFETYAISLINYNIKSELRKYREFKLNTKIFKIIKYIENNDFKLEDIKKKFNVSEKMLLDAINYKCISIFDETFFVKEDTFNEIISYLDGIDKKIIIYRFKYNMFIKDISKLVNLRPQIVSRRIKRTLNKLFELIK